MRRVSQVSILVLIILLFLPATGASADHCPSISGKAFLDFGRSGTGMASVVYDGQKLMVPFEGTGGGDVENGIFEFDFFFPQGKVTIEEHSTFTSIGGPVGQFNSTLYVVGNGSGQWTWSGTANVAGGKAVIKSLSGTLCID